MKEEIGVLWAYQRTEWKEWGRAFTVGSVWPASPRKGQITAAKDKRKTSLQTQN